MQFWIYSTFVDVPEEELQKHRDIYHQKMKYLVREVRELRFEHMGDTASGQSVLMGGVHRRVMGLLTGYNRRDAEKADPSDKWLFKVGDPSTQ